MEAEGSRSSIQLNTTGRDYALFVDAVLNGKGLSSSVLRHMETPEIALDPTCRICFEQEPKELSKTLGFLAPHSNLEFALFVALALTAAFCEEIIFRGYLQKQFAAASGMASIGILAQGVLFGAAHGYQGAKLMFTIGVYGALFGILAAWRKSLRPGMMAHFLQDFISGLLLRFLTQAPR